MMEALCIEELLLFQQEQDELMVAILACSEVLEEQKRQRAVEADRSKSRKHRFWVHPIWQGRSQLGSYNTLIRELTLDGEKFKEFFRLKKEQFTQVLSCIEEDLVKISRVREVICPRQRLALCIR